MSKGGYLVASAMLFVGYGVLTYLAMRTYANLGLPDQYGFVPIIFLAVAWAWLQNKLRDTRRPSQKAA